MLFFPPGAKVAYSLYQELNCWCFPYCKVNVSTMAVNLLVHLLAKYYWDEELINNAETFHAAATGTPWELFLSF